MKNHFADLLDELQFPNLKQKKKKIKKTPVLILPLKPVL